MPLLSLIFAIALAGPVASGAPVCDGRYATSDELVDSAIAKYGTLYSGGSHRHRLDTVGASLDLYRLWRGLPDISLRSVHPPDWREDGFGYGWNELEGTEIWPSSGGLVEGPEPGKRLQRVFAAWGADAVTSLGPAPDWWLHADDFDGLTATQRQVAELAPTEPVLDWLQVLLVASSAPGAAFSHLGGAEPEAAVSSVLAEHAWRRYAPEEGHAWAVATALAHPESSPEVEDWLARLEREVLDCTASAADHAAWAVVVHGRDRWTPDPEDADELRRLAHLPPYTRMDLLDQRLMRMVAGGQLPQDPDGWTALLLEDDRAGARLRGRLDHVRALAATTAAQLPPPEHAAVVRLLNGLSSDDLATYAELHGLDAWLVPVLYARAVALGDWQAAEELLPRLAASSETAGETVKSAKAVRGAREAKLAWVALQLDAVQLHICGGHTGADLGLSIYQSASCGAVELPTDYAAGAAFERDLEVFFRLPSRWYAFWGMHGVSISRIERLRERGLAVVVPEDDLPKVNGGPFPVAGLLDLSTADAASGPPILMPRVAAILLAWAESQTDSWLTRRGRHGQLIAESLSTLIRRCRHTTCGEVEGRPAQQVAFELLHRQLPDSEAALNTPIWWASGER